MQQTGSDALWAPLLALEAARDALHAGTPEAADTIRRIAGRITEAARAVGLQRVAIAARVLQTTSVPEFGAIVERVLEYIRTEITRPAAAAQSVLLVEVDTDTATIIAEALRAPEREVLLAATRAEAERILSEHQVAVLILGLSLSDLVAREWLASLRTATRTAWLPVLVLVKQSDALTTSQCYALGADGVLVRPLDSDVLKSAVGGRLQRVRQLQRATQLDALTLLPDRPAFWDAYEQALSERGGAPLSVAVLDVDGFRTINETYGHAAGDQALRIVARVLANSLRGRDFLSRWAGGEFCVFMPHTSTRGAARVLNTALERVLQTSIAAADGRTFNLSFSAGVATVSAGVGGGDALAEADRLLYTAKRLGRSRVLAEGRVPLAARVRVLLADDDAPTRGVVRKILEQEGFEVVTFSDGASALSAAADGDFAIAIVDVGMPVMDGFDLVRHLRALPHFTTVPIVMLTGASSEADVVLGFELGASDYVLKPFNRGELVARVSRLLRRR